MRAVSRLCELYTGTCLTTEEKARKNLSQGSRRVLVYILPKRTRYKTHTPTQAHITKPTHTHYKTHTHPHITKPTHTYITKPVKTTTVQVKTNTVQDIPKWNSHNIIKYPQYKVNGTFIHKNFAVTNFTSLHFIHKNFTVTHFTSLILSLHYSLHFTSLILSLYCSLHFTRCHWRLEQLLVCHHYRHN